MIIKDIAQKVVKELCYGYDVHPHSYIIQVTEDALIEAYNAGIEDAASMTTPATGQCIRSLKKETSDD